jgi:hypothetical protein
VPEEWLAHDGVFIPMYQREAMWLAFGGASWRPNAVQIGIGKINAVSGEDWNERLSASPQNYIVCPDQPWLDGINVSGGVIRQFISMPLGMGYTVEAQLTGREQHGGIQIRVYEPKPGLFPERPPASHARKPAPRLDASPRRMALGGMGLGAGGKIRQKIYPDPYGLDAWNQEKFGSVFVHIINVEQYRELTGKAPPPTSVSAGSYTEHGFPWFELYDEKMDAIGGSEALSRVKTISQQDVATGSKNVQDDATVEVEPTQVRKIKPHPKD